RATLRPPLTPSTMMLRASAIVPPTKAIRTFGRLLPRRKIHSAPARVFPNPRPAIISQVRQPSPPGGSWLACAHCSKSASYFRACSTLRLQITLRCCSSDASRRIRCSLISTPYPGSARFPLLLLGISLLHPLELADEPLANFVHVFLDHLVLGLDHRLAVR